MITETKKKEVTSDDMRRMSNDEKLAATDFFVEADSFSISALWSKYFYDPKQGKTKFPSSGEMLHWEQDGSGFARCVGFIGHGKSKPVMVTFSWYLIGTKYVCFYNASSRFVDWTMIEEYLDKNFPIKYDNESRIARTDASNFVNCYHWCQEPH